MDRRDNRVSALRLATTAAVVLVACHLGARFGTWLRFPEIGSALLFPPYAIVTAALCRLPPRHWWIVLLAAGLGDIGPHLRGGASVTFALCAELLNHSRAVLAAIGIRRFAGKIETLREMVAYMIIAVAVAPALAAIGGAVLVTTLGTSDDFLLAWQQWWLSNAITAVTLLPVLLLDFRKLAAFSPRRLVETTLYVVVLVVGTGWTLEYVHPTHMYWALPFLLLAAARFGAHVTSAVLLAVTMLSIWGAVGRSDGFVTSSESLLELQVFLIDVAIPLLLLAVLIDQQRRTASELTLSRRQIQSIVEDQTEMICRFRPDGTCTFANRAYCEAFAASDPVGRSVWQLAPTGVHHTALELQQLTRASPLATHEVSVPTTDRALRWQQWQERGLFDERGAIVEYQAVGRDITDRKRAEDEHAELEAQRSVEAALREADRRKDEFLAMLGHELRNPLAPLGIAVKVLVEAPPGSSEAAWARGSIERQLGKMTRLIDDLLDLSRVTLGKIQLQLDAVNLATVIESAVEETRPLINSLGHQLIVTLPDAPVWLRADAVRLTQVVANLLHNAAKYTERGGRIEVTVTRDDAGVCIAVRDNGIGLDPACLETIFGLFSQLPDARERAQGGLGIGLTLVRRLVELHGGSVVARSEGRNCGSEMVVHLPIAAQDALAPSRPVTPQVTPRASLRILAVDDNVDIAKGLAAVLGLWGHTVQTAHDGEAALAIATAFAPDVVLLDLGLPSINGVEVAHRLQTSEYAPTLLVSMSGFGNDYVRQRAAENGFDYHIVKPIDLDWLRTLLDKCAHDKPRAPTA
ncbi:MAG TPA: ATP-binding protein [Kofleriaceae bacterium]|nr:ATP-binding protein [Kofleriaceae bacterium]